MQSVKSALRASLVVSSALWLASCATSSDPQGLGDGAAPPLRVSLSPTIARPRDSYTLFLNGQAALSGGQVAKAADLFAEASTASPTEPYLRQKAFSTLLLAGQVDRAAEIAASGPLEGDDSEKGLGVLTRAVAAVANGDAKGALVLLSNDAALGPHRAAAALIRPWLAASVGDWPAATAPIGADADRLVAAFGALGRAQLLERGGRSADAETVYRNLIASHDAIYVLAYGAFLERARRGQEAATLYNQALNRAPGDPSFQAARARVKAQGAPPSLPSFRDGAAQALISPAAVLVAERQAEAGLSYLRLALRLDPSHGDAWVLAGETLAAAGDATGARSAFAQVKPDSDDYSAARSRLALSFQQAGDKSQALAVAKATVAALPNDPGSLVIYAELLRDAEQFDSAIQVLNGLIDKGGASGADARLYYLRGANEERAGRWPEAEADLRKSLKLAPNEAEVLNYLGFAWVDRGEHLKEGLDMLQRAVAMAPDSGAIIDSLGWARFKLKDFTGAVRDLERAVVMEASDPEVNDHLGDAYWRAGRKVEARYQWRRVLSLHPQDRMRATVEQKLATGLDDPATGQPMTPTL